MPAAAAGEPAWMALIGPISMTRPSQRMGLGATRTESCLVLASVGGCALFGRQLPLDGHAQRLVRDGAEIGVESPRAYGSVDRRA